MSSTLSYDVVPVDGTDKDRNAARSDPAADASVQLLVDAETIHANHFADEDGYCRGCLRQWARLTRHPCSQSRWAVAVIEEHHTHR